MSAATWRPSAIVLAVAIALVAIALRLILFASDEKVAAGSPQERKLIEAAFKLDVTTVRQFVCSGDQRQCQIWRSRERGGFQGSLDTWMADGFGQLECLNRSFKQ